MSIEEQIEKLWIEGSMSLKDFRKKIMLAQEKMEALPESITGKDLDTALPMNHSFGNGIYMRERFAPKGTLLISEIHKYKHPFFLTKGKCAVLTEDGVTIMEAPCQGMTEPGTKRAVFIMEDVAWTTVHATDGTDPDEIVEEITVKDFKAFTEFELRELTKKTIEHEKPGFWSDWTKEQQEAYSSGDWERFSRLRGYSEEEIEDFSKWVKLMTQMECEELSPHDVIRDITVNAAIRNMKEDTNDEILLSSHCPYRGKVEGGDKCQS